MRRLQSRSPQALAALAVAAMAVLPFVVAFAFIHPSWDDAGFYLEYKTRGLIGSQVLWYQWISGRYVSDAIVTLLSPTIHSVWIYRAACLAIFLVLLYSIHRLLRTALELPRVNAAALAGLTLTAFLVVSPGIAEGFYWLTGAATYTLGSAFLFMAFASILSDDAEGRMRFTTGLWIVLAIGMNEVYLLVLCGYLALVLARDVLDTRSAPRRHVVWFLVALVAAVASLGAPGNFRRLEFSRDVLSTHREASSALVGAARYFVLDTYYLMHVGPIFFLLLAAISLGGQTSGKRPHPGGWRREMATLAAMLVVFYGVVAFFTYAQGVAPIPRVLHAIYLPMIAAATVMVVRLARHSGLSQGLPMLAMVIALTGFADAAVRIGSGVRFAYTEWLRGDWGRYDREIVARDRLAREHVGRDVVVPPISARPLTIFVYDISPDPAQRHNVLYAYYYGVRTIAVSAKSEGGTSR